MLSSLVEASSKSRVCNSAFKDKNKMLSPLFEMRPKSNVDWESFLLDHNIQHDAIYSALSQQGKFFSKFPIKDAEKGDTDWLNNHQSEHEGIFSALGLTGVSDLSTFDLNNQEQFEIWQQTHNDIHLFINSSLGI